MVWLTCMPFCIYEQLGPIATTPVAMAMAFLLLGIDEIGVQLEEPFSILALENMCDAVVNTVRQTVTESKAASAVMLDSFDDEEGDDGDDIEVAIRNNGKRSRSGWKVSESELEE